jgi:hypothetical protein
MTAALDGTRQAVADVARSLCRRLGVDAAN